MAAAAAASAGGAAAVHGSDVELLRMNRYPDGYKPNTPSPQRSNKTEQPAMEESMLKTVGRSLRKSIAEFFLGEEDQQATRQKWLNRCQSLHANKLVGGHIVKEDEDLTEARSIDTLDNSVFTESHGDEVLRTAFAAGKRTPQPIDPLARHRRMDSRSSKGSHYGYGNPLSRQYSHISTVSSRRSMRSAPSKRNRRDSVFKMAFDGIKTIGKPTTKSGKKPHNSRSFAPGSISSYYEDIESIKYGDEHSEVRSQNFEPEMKFCELTLERSSPYCLVMEPPVLPHIKERVQFSSTSPAIDSVFSPDEYIDDVFFNTPNPTSPRVDLFAHRTKPPLPVVHGTYQSNLDLPTIQERSRISEIREEVAKEPQDDQMGALLLNDYEDGKEPLETVVTASGWAKGDERPQGGEKYRPPPLTIPKPAGVPVPVTVEPDYPDPAMRLIHKPVRGGWQSGRMKPQPLPGTPDLLGLEEVDTADMVDGIERIGDVMKGAIYDWNNSDRREVGKGFVGKLFDREYKENLSPDVQKQIDAMNEHRPYFTYWATFIQIVIYIVAVSVYGIAPWGFEETAISGEVLKPSLAIEKVNYFEKDNLWVGPRQADLIHLGAKYSPCMRADENVVNAIASDRDVENKTACCIRNDGSGCLQTSKGTCSPTLSTWFNWTEETSGPNGRLSGSVCGQDPRFCNNPASIIGAYEWPDDITKWPICLEPIVASPKNENIHMTCPMVGRPCCVGIQGACIITTREYCEFRKGYFHEEATLCAQVDCMSEICGMIPFRIPEQPDQFYRLWTSLFLHAGLLQLVVTILFQFFVMRDMEKLCGWLRTCIIYIGSGIAGSLASAIFLPYHVEAGPAGSQFGIIGCLFAELIQNFTLLKNPWWALAKQFILLFVLFAFGLLPYVDNYAHLFGLFVGFLLSFALLPFITFNKCDRTRKIIGIVVCLLLAVGSFSFLTVLFYVTPIYNCPFCHYFNCIPFTNKFCKSMEVRIGRDEIY